MVESEPSRKIILDYPKNISVNVIWGLDFFDKIRHNGIIVIAIVIVKIVTIIVAAAWTGWTIHVLKK